VILRRLGQGTMGIVYLARGADEKRIALKVVRPEWAHEADFLRRFAHEVKHASRVDAAYTAKVVAVSTDASHPYLAAEFIDGPTLEAEVTVNGPLPLPRAKAVAIGTAAALIAIHEGGIVHRDLKPSNVLLSHSGPQVIDFGIARSLGATTRLTQIGSRVGAPAYMSPEQILDADLTPASDVFSWAGMVVYASTGHQPFGGPDTNMIALYRKVLEGQPNLTDVPAELHSILEAAFAKEPTARPTARDLLALLTGNSHVVGDPKELADRAIRKIVELRLPFTDIPGGTTVDEHLGRSENPYLKASTWTWSQSPLDPAPLEPAPSNLCPVFMPPLGDTILEGTVEHWWIKEGEYVHFGESLFRVSSDMLSGDIPSPDSGVLRDIAVDDGETVPISSQLAVIDRSPAERSSNEPFRHQGWSWSPPS